jgi:hypothetical protein
VKFRKPGDWYVNQDVEVKDGGILIGTYGNGATPEEAIEDHWRVLTEIPRGHYLVVRAFDNLRRAVRWNGFMWEDVKESAAA